jgi:hypothetical protein
MYTTRLVNLRRRYRYRRHDSDSIPTAFERHFLGTLRYSDS